MASSSPFEMNPEIAAMRQDIADRSFRVKMTGMLVSAGLAAAAIGLLFVMPAGVGMIQPLFGVALAAASGLTAMLTFKETKRLEIDQQFLQAKMQGKNWWGSYREEVVQNDHGQGVQPPAFHGIPPQPTGRTH